MLQLSVIALDNILEYCALLYIYYSVCGIKQTRHIKLVLLHGVTILGFIGVSQCVDSYVLKCLSYTFIGLLPAGMFYKKIYVKLGISLLESIIQFVSELLIVAVLSKIYNFNTLPLPIGLYAMSAVYSRLAALVITVLVSKILSKRLTFYYKVSAGKTIWLIALITAGFFVLNTLFQALLQQRDSFFEFFAAICMTCVVFMYLIFNEFERQEQKMRDQKYAYMCELQAVQEENWKRITEKNSKMKGLVHDVKNFLLLIHGHITAGEIKTAQLKLEDYLDKLTSAQSIETGVHMLDTVISAKEALAEEQCIAFQCTVFMDSGLLIDPADLAMAVANAMDNALEAASKIEDPAQKSIFLEIRTVGQYLHVAVENTVAEPVDIKNNHVETTKQDKDLHGFGLKSMQMLTEKYDGKLLLDYKEGMFYTIMLFKNQND